MNHQTFIRTMERVERYKQLIADLNNENSMEIGEQRRAYTRADIYADYGRRFCKVSVGNTVHTFIDLETGDILKAASYKAPAKNGVRGNIWAEDLGASSINWYGAKYLK